MIFCKKCKHFSIRLQPEDERTSLYRSRKYVCLKNKNKTGNNKVIPYNNWKVSCEYFVKKY